MTSKEQNKTTGTFFPKLDADDADETVTQLDSLCMKCLKQGVTKLLLTKIPFFKEVIISSFHCNECGHTDNSIQSGGCIQEKGIRYTVQIKSPEDLNRQLIMSEYASFFLPSLDFEQPPAKKSAITTVEGILNTIYADLLIFQPERREADPDMAVKIDEFLKRFVKLKTLDEPFEIVVDDPSGNSFVENLSAPKTDEQATVVHYTRTADQNQLVGALAAQNENEDGDTKPANTSEQSYSEGELNLKNEVMQFRSNCSECNSPCDTNMKLVDIPYFKQVVIMATICDACGYRDNEVKAASGIADEGLCIDLRITDKIDLNRDVLKSDSCAVRIPELELEVQEGTMGGKFTTIEGLLINIRDQLSTQNPFVVGDSSQDSIQNKVKQFCAKLDKVIQGEMLNIHFILDDPAGNSYLQNLFSPDDDPEMTITQYKRSFEQNETLGLNDMKTENYQQKVAS